jgi:hypothetical protein
MIWDAKYRTPVLLGSPKKLVSSYVGCFRINQDLYQRCFADLFCAKDKKLLFLGRLSSLLSML